MQRTIYGTDANRWFTSLKYIEFTDMNNTRIRNQTCDDHWFWVAAGVTVLRDFFFDRMRLGYGNAVQDVPY